MDGIARKGRPRKRAPSENRDGFRWIDEGVSAHLYNYLYNVVPDGQRRQMMMRFMLVGFATERGIRLGKTDFVPPVPVEGSHPKGLTGLDARRPTPGVPAAAQPQTLEQSVAVPASPAPVVNAQAVPQGTQSSVVKPGLFAAFKG